MRLQDDIDFTTLNWVKQELDETLKQARQALEAFVEDPADTSQMRFCATYLHQVQGTLRMVELYGASMVVEEMERLAQALLDGQIRQKDEAYSVLMRGIVQLPDYLERLQSGHKDIPIVLLPLLNDLRACRGEKLLSESVLFSPDLNAPLPPEVQGPANAMDPGELRVFAGKCRLAFQMSLLKVIKNDSFKENLGKLADIADRLVSVTRVEEARRIWWAAAGLAEAMRDEAVESGSATKLLFGKVDREIKRLVDEGEQTFRANAPFELLKNLLYYVAQARSLGPRVNAMRMAYRLDALVPSQQEIEHARGSMSGHNKALLTTVAGAIKEDLLRVKEALDLFLRTQSSNPADLASQTDVLDRVADTLGMLGLGVPRRVVIEQRGTLADISSGKRKIDETALLDIAGALLYVEASLDDHIDRLGASEQDESTGMELPKAEVRRILEALMKEAETNLGQAKQDIVAFVESPWDHARVDQVPKLLEEIAGALRMLDQKEPSDLLTAVSRFVEVELSKHRRVPTSEQLDALADAMASLEYYIEALRDQRGNRDKMLAVARKSLETLGYWPIPAEESAADSAKAAEPVAAPEAPQNWRSALESELGNSDAPVSTPTPAPAPIAETPKTIDYPKPEIVDLAPIVTDEPVVTAPESAGADVEELPVMETGESLDEFLQRIGQQDQPADVIEAASGADDLPTAVEIAQGSGLEALIVGEPGPASQGQEVQDLSGLRLTDLAEREAPQTQVQPEAEPVAEIVADEEEDEFEDEGHSEGLVFQAVPSDDIDEEIREVFVDEVQEELDNLDRIYPQWKAKVDDFELLKPIRRSFHTLKGSGRLVGALAIGEFSWKIENMLNRVLDKSITPGPAVLALLDHTMAALPQLLDALKGGARPKANIGGIMAVADRLGAGEDAWLPERKPKVKVAKPVATTPAPVQAPAASVAPVAVPAPRPEPGIPTAIDIPMTHQEAETMTTIESANALDLGPSETPGSVPFDEALELTSAVDFAPVDAPADAVHAHAAEPEARVEVPYAREPQGDEDEAPIAIDPVLFEILRSEVQAHLAVINEYLASVLDPRHAPVATEALMRAVHTLNGAVSMVDVPVITRVVSPLEGYVKRLLGQNLGPSPQGVDLMHRSVSLVEKVMTELEQEHPAFPDSYALAEEATALRDALPEPTSPHRLIPLHDEDEELELHAIEVDTPLAVSFEEPSPIDLGLSVSEETPEPETVFELPEFEMPAAPLDQWADAETIEIESAPLVSPDSVDSIDAGSGLELADLLGFETVAEAPVVKPAEPELPEFSFELGGIDLDSIPVGTDEFKPLEPTTDLPAEIEPTTVEPTAGFATFELPTVAPELPSEPEQTLAPVEPETVESIDLFGTEVGEGAETFDIDQIMAQLAQVGEPPAAGAETAGTEAAADFDWSSLLGADVESIPVASSEFTEPKASEPEKAPEPTLEEPAPAFEMPAHIEPEPLPEPVAEAPAEVPAVSAPAAVPVAAVSGMVVAPLPQDTDPEGVLELPDMDEDLLEIFVQEGSDILDLSDGLMAKLRDAPEDRDIVTGLQRELHTLKGGARMAALHPIGDLAHTMESLFEAVSEGRTHMTPVAVETLERGFDRLHAMVQRVARKQAIGMPVHTVDRLDALATGRALPMIQVVQEVSEADESGAPAAATPTPAPRALTPTRADEEEEGAARTQQEMIRVRSDLLDALVNYAGEVSIYRSRLEQQIGTFRFNLVELEQTVARLREQLRKLEIETEAQILSRFQREAEQASTAGGQFDPLELDRFSTLQQLSRALAESVSDLVSIQNLLDDVTRQSETLLLQQSRVSSELQEGLMRTRMVPFDSLVPRLRRIMRQTGSELGKKAQLRVEGAQGEMDRTVLERMTAPLEHMLRNALAHGLETPDERRKAGKAEDGQIVINVSRESTEVVLRVSDDGRGMDRDAIRRKAIERGLLKADARLSDRDLYGFILETGFSTAETVSKIAGRGVGMDVVNSEIKQLGGTLQIDSERGKGSRFTVRLPFTLAVTQAIMVKLGSATYAIPMSSVQGVVRMPRKELERRLQEGELNLTYAGETYLIYDLANLLGVEAVHGAEDIQVPLLMTRTGDQRSAIRIDSVQGSREIVVKSVGPQLSSIPGIFGATIMGDGSVVIILDLAPLVRRHAALREAGEVLPDLPIMPEEQVAAERKPLIMVVDDSITMRKVTSRVLERNELDVATAKDGLDAVEQMQEIVPDLVLLDIEMPRMDGYEVATYMRNDPRLRGVPIIMITSRTGEKHRQRAFELGVNRYLGKPYQEVDLLKNVQEVLKEVRASH